MECSGFMSMKEVRELYGLYGSTLNRKIKSGEFPAPHKLGGRRNFFLRSELVAWEKALHESVTKPAHLFAGAVKEHEESKKLHPIKTTVLDPVKVGAT